MLETDPTVVLAYAKAEFIDESGKRLDITDPGWDLRSEAAHERLRYVIYADHLVNAPHGLIRQRALSKTRLIANYPGGDYRLLGELALHGKFIELQHCLFLRRFHPGSSSQNRDSIDWQVTFYTGSSRHLRLPRWQRTLDHFATIMRSQLVCDLNWAYVRSSPS